ncbi:protein-L-isoaspartate O-methyltransferase family protein [Lihuaxuella thermophila]|uniref:Protein-L-isoaspartate O-methyltransferase n=1 Tax=Lihuaxuella thermophila TaxID=1173111 RepID=A0A1H8GX61_9BACL|nr:methyltransferase domain-containing protein [Lihuaxuella thermophila]SEN48662.1 protein-L-isoaspartate(D-aspartate) O-methyltransferase [Lihuaxuella thermophila]
MSRVDEAFQNVNRDEFVLREDGSIVIQSTASNAIKSGLEMLDVKEGSRVLEIGTGSGFSGALLSYLAGSSGTVVSLDIEPELTRRARELFKQKNITNVRFETKDGREGFESEAPYDRIIAWATPEHIPDAWKDQVSNGGILVTPFRVLPIARCTVTVSLRKVDGVLKGESVSGEGYIMMSSEPIQDIEKFAGYQIHADLIGKGEDPVWASSIWMKQFQGKEWLERFDAMQSETSPFQEKGEEIRAYLLGKNPEGFTYAFHPDSGYWVGYSSPDGFALVSERQPKQWVVTDKIHKDVLCDWWDDWKRLGKPSYEQLQPYMAGNQIKVKLKGGV